MPACIVVLILGPCSTCNACQGRQHFHAGSARFISVPHHAYWCTGLVRSRKLWTAVLKPSANCHQYAVKSICVSHLWQEARCTSYLCRRLQKASCSQHLLGPEQPATLGLSAPSLRPRHEVTSAAHPFGGSFRFVVLNELHNGQRFLPLGEGRSHSTLPRPAPPTPGGAWPSGAPRAASKGRRAPQRTQKRRRKSLDRSSAVAGRSSTRRQQRRRRLSAGARGGPPTRGTVNPGRHAMLSAWALL
eukprot:363132-Chlamydomonas_euryale.AAC.8